MSRYPVAHDLAYAGGHARTARLAGRYAGGHARTASLAATLGATPAQLASLVATLVTLFPHSGHGSRFRPMYYCRYSGSRHLRVFPWGSGVIPSRSGPSVRIVSVIVMVRLGSVRCLPGLGPRGSGTPCSPSVLHARVDLVRLVASVCMCAYGISVVVAVRPRIYRRRAVRAQLLPSGQVSYSHFDRLGAGSHFDRSSS